MAEIARRDVAETGAMPRLEPIAPPADWRPFVSNEIIDRPIGATHELMTSAEALAEIGPRLAELLETAERLRSDGERW